MRPTLAALGVSAALMALAGCLPENPQLLNISQDGEGPDEFLILPTRPLEMPEDLAALPQPNPGGGNRVDRDPEAEVAAALGGDITRAPQGGADLMAYVTRFGVSGDIRSVTAAEDLDYRRRNDGRLLERAFNVNVYYGAYEPLSLDQYAELERLRRAGVRTPAAPPQR